LNPRTSNIQRRTLNVETKALRWPLALLGRAVPEKSYTVEHGERKTRFQHPRVVIFGWYRAKQVFAGFIFIWTPSSGAFAVAT
jgi:hypothetical protein